MRTQNEHIKTLKRRVDFLKTRDHRNSYDQAELGALEWALVNLPPQQGPDVDRLVELARADERRAMMQLFTDPENQPTQHGTVTLEYMQREIADEREQIAQMIENAPILMPFSQNEQGGCLLCGFTPRFAATAIRARSKK